MSWRSRESPGTGSYILSRPGEKIYVSQLGRLLGLSERGGSTTISPGSLAPPPSEFVGRTRINAACEYLQMGFTVSDASSACGFSAFCGLFRRHKGVPPRAYAAKYVKIKK